MHFQFLEKMVLVVLVIQASLVASEASYRVTRFEIGDHGQSLAEESLKTLVLFRDQVNAERRKSSSPNKKLGLKAVTESSDDELESQECLESFPTADDFIIDML